MDPKTAFGNASGPEPEYKVSLNKDGETVITRTADYYAPKARDFDFRIPESNDDYKAPESGSYSDFVKSMEKYSMPKRFMAGAMKPGCDCAMCKPGGATTTPHQSSPSDEQKMEEKDRLIEELRREIEHVRKQRNEATARRSVVERIIDRVADALSFDLTPGEDDEAGRYAVENLERIVPATVAMVDEKIDAEAEAKSLDTEADHLAAALEYVTIERDHLLGVRDWCETELTAAWEQIEEAA